MTRLLASNAKCPYCKGKLPKAPIKPHSCPSCKKVFYVLPDENGARFVVTKDDLKITFQGWDFKANINDKHRITLCCPNCDWQQAFGENKFKEMLESAQEHTLSPHTTSLPQEAPISDSTIKSINCEGDEKALGHQQNSIQNDVKSEPGRVLASTLLCPNCSAKLLSLPKKRGVCPSCKKYYYIASEGRINYILTKAKNNSLEKRTKRVQAQKINKTPKVPIPPSVPTSNNNQITSPKSIFDEIRERSDEIRKQQRIANSHCPRCGSTNVGIQKKGFGTGKALTGAVLFGPIGLAGGLLGSGGNQRVCLDCGKNWPIIH